MKVTTNCPQCGKTFEYYLSWPRIYCSKKCSGLAHADEKRTKVEVVCEECGKKFSRTPFEIQKVRHVFCSRTCFSIYQSRAMKGKPAPFTGMKFQERTKNGTVLKVCKQCGNGYRIKKSRADRNSFCSTRCEYDWMSANMKGDNNPAWQGGYEAYYGPNWLQQRRNARRRDNYTCQRCGLKEADHYRQLDVHHIIPFRVFGVQNFLQANKLSNLVTLCNTCHVVVEHEQGTRPNPIH